MNLHGYYDRRAGEYEAIYFRDDPVRQDEQRQLAECLKEAVWGRRVLEIACGTGYWTQFAAQTARHVLGTDTSTEMLAAAQTKRLSPAKVTFQRADAYELEGLPGPFEAGVANFWFSHVPRARMHAFLDRFHRALAPGAVVFMADNVLVPGIGGQIVTYPDRADTFKRRCLSDGSRHEILKNYYTERELSEILAAVTDLKIHMGRCFWWVIYQVP
jgi:ubiquinone/menaquinone biosynthesis C-methylase UbiE